MLLSIDSELEKLPSSIVDLSMYTDYGVLKGL